MRYKEIREAIFVRRLNRFIAEVVLDEKIEQVHIKNTSRCQELFLEGAKVYLEKSNNPNRKTKYSLISVYKKNELVNVDSQVPNQVVYEALLDGKIKEIQDVTFAKREVTYGQSRFDIYYETNLAKGFIEVKGVTLEADGLAKFPDAPTTRGTKHVSELTEALDEGYKNYVFFLIQLKNVQSFRPHHERDLKFADAIYNGMDKGLEVLVYTSYVDHDGIELNSAIPILQKVY